MTSPLFPAPHAPRTSLEQLPKSLRDELGRGGRSRTRPIPPPTRELQEAIAHEALSCGIQPSGRPFAYLIRRLRHGLGVCNYPSPPTMTDIERQRIDSEVDRILTKIGARRAA